MLKILKQPYPRNNNWPSCVASGLFFGLFVFLFLILFRPFGLHELRSPQQFFIYAGYGIITAAIIIFHSTFSPLLFPNHFDELNWTVLKEIVHSVAVIMVIGIGNVLYSYYLHFFDLSTDTFLRFQLITLIVAALPVTLMIMLRQIRLLKNNLREAHLLSSQIKPSYPEVTVTQEKELLLLAENEKDQFSISADTVLYIGAADNYIEIVFKSEHEIKRRLLRCSLKRAEQQLEMFKQFYRCHRTYIVNLTRVQAVTGNAQGYKLIFEKHEQQIPVSRNLNKEITALLLGKKSG